MKSHVALAILAGSSLMVLAYLCWPGSPRVTESDPPFPAATASPATQEVELGEAFDDVPAMPASVDRPVGTSEEMFTEGPADTSANLSFNDSVETFDGPTDTESFEEEDEFDSGESLDPGEQLTMDQTATTDTSLRNSDYPRTYISAIRVDLESPDHWVRLTWSGPEADRQETGPFHSSPGRGLGNNDCNDVDESNRNDSNCTPKGKMSVEGFSNTMPTYSHCRFVTWFLISRGIAFHSYHDVPNYPASHGCVRLNEHAAQLIHNNSKIGATDVTVDGTWTFDR